MALSVSKSTAEVATQAGINVSEVLIRELLSLLPYLHQAPESWTCVGVLEQNIAAGAVQPTTTNLLLSLQRPNLPLMSRHIVSDAPAQLCE